MVIYEIREKTQIKWCHIFEFNMKDILNGNYSFKKIYPISHEIINHFTIDKNNIKNDDTGQSLKYGCTYRYYKKLTTFIYYKPNKKENKDKK